MGKKILIGTVSAVFALVSSGLHAANFSYTGTFVADNDVQLFDFTLDSLSSVTLRTYGYGGGTQADGNEVQAGGFNPMITVFDSLRPIGVEFDVPLPAPLDTIDTSTGLAMDAWYTASLPAGSYTVALTQHGNFARGDNPAAGFFFESEPTFSTFFEISASCSNGLFCSYDSADNPVNRTGAWAIDILDVSSASMVPVPAAVWLFGSGLLGLVALARRKST